MLKNYFKNPTLLQIWPWVIQFTLHYFAFFIFTVGRLLPHEAGKGKLANGTQ